MFTRLGGVALVLVMLVGLALGSAGTAAATEAEGPAQQEPLPSFSEVGSQSDIAQEFLPEGYEGPSWFQWLLFPLLIVGIVVTVAVLFAYLVWLPKFADEQKTKRRR